MKLSPRDAKAFFARPDAGRPGILIFGPDAQRITLRRKDLVATVIGPEGEAEMRLTRLGGSDLRADPAALQDAIKAVGFFPGPRAVLLEEATDGLTVTVAAALAAWAPGDAMLVATAGDLKATSKLRKLFEGHKTAAAAAMYDDPPTRDEIEAELRRAGLVQIDRAAMGDLESLARSLEPGDFRQTLDKIALYKHGDATPLSADEVALLAPATLEAEVDEVLHAVAEGRTGDIGPLMQRLAGQATPPVTLTIAAGRHFRALHVAASDPGGPEQGMGRLRPPPPYKLRGALTRQAQTWGQARLEEALSMVLETDLALRSANQTAPQMALVERMFIRLANLARAR